MPYERRSSLVIFFASHPSLCQVKCRVKKQIQGKNASTGSEFIYLGITHTNVKCQILHMVARFQDNSDEEEEKKNITSNIGTGQVSVKVGHIALCILL